MAEQRIEAARAHTAGLATGGARRDSDGGDPAAVAAIEVDWEALARSTAHPLRIAILEVLGIDGGRTLSPSDLSAELQVYLSKVDYHVDRLRRTGLIELVKERPVRGATEHFYRLAPAGP